MISDILRMQMSTLMMAAYKDFRELAEQLSAEHSAGRVVEEQHETRAASGYSWDDYTDEEVSEDSYAPGDDSDVEQSCVDDASCTEEFPGRKYFSFRDIDVNDPAFYSGKSLGIPISEAVYRNKNQNKYFPDMD